MQPVHTQKLGCLLGIGRGTNEVWAACQPVRDHYVGGAGRPVMFIAEEPALLDPPAVSADGGQLFIAP